MIPIPAARNGVCWYCREVAEDPVIVPLPARMFVVCREHLVDYADILLDRVERAMEAEKTGAVRKDG